MTIYKHHTVVKHNLNDSTVEMPKVLAPTLNKAPVLHVASESNQVTAHASESTGFGSHRRSVSNVPVWDLGVNRSGRFPMFFVVLAR